MLRMQLAAVSSYYLSFFKLAKQMNQVKHCDFNHFMTSKIISQRNFWLRNISYRRQERSGPHLELVLPEQIA